MPAISEENRVREVLEQWSHENQRTVAPRFDLDATGTPAVWIQVVVDDDEAKKGAFSQLTATIRGSIRQLFADAGIDLWPYVRFRTQSEVAEFSRELA